MISSRECRYCGDRFGPFEVDHVIPLVRGGTDDLENLACACFRCNAEKSDDTIERWRSRRRAAGNPWPPLPRDRSDPLPILLSIREVTSKSGIPRSTIYEAIHRGELPVYRFGRGGNGRGPSGFRVDTRDLVAWISSKREMEV